MSESSQPRVFSVEEVEALIPELSERVAKQMTLQDDIESLLRQLADLTGEVPGSLEPVETDSSEARALKARIREIVRSYERGWRDVQGLGAVIKDPQTGLLDFYGQVDGRLVWLCWRYGEEHLGYYHDLDAGFAGRKALEGDTRGRLLN